MCYGACIQVGVTNGSHGDGIQGPVSKAMYPGPCIQGAVAGGPVSKGKLMGGIAYVAQFVVQESLT